MLLAHGADVPVDGSPCSPPDLVADWGNAEVLKCMLGRLAASGMGELWMVAEGEEPHTLTIIYPRYSVPNLVRQLRRMEETCVA